MNELIKIISQIQDPKTIFILCAIFIFGDVSTGYLKAFKLRKVNSSISRDGYIKKLGWIISLLLGLLVYFATKTNIMLVGSMLVCIGTEGISIGENLGEIGIKLPFMKYFEKLKDGVDNDKA